MLQRLNCRLLNGAGLVVQTTPALVLEVPSAGVLLRMGAPVTAFASSVHSVSALGPLLACGPVRANFVQAVAGASAMLRFGGHRAQRVLQVSPAPSLLSYGSVQKLGALLVAQGAALRYGTVRMQLARTFAVEDGSALLRFGTHSLIRTPQVLVRPMGLRYGCAAFLQESCPC